MKAIFCYAPELSSPPITKGAIAQRIWKLQSRLKRLDRHRPMSPIMGLEYFPYVMALTETIEHLEELGVYMQ